MNIEELTLFVTSKLEDSFVSEDQDSLTEYLDDLVIGQKEAEASQINTAGHLEQIKYLLESGWTPEDLFDSFGLDETGEEIDD